MIRFSNSLVISAGIVAVLAASGCHVELEEIASDAFAAGCPVSHCGGNSPTDDLLPFGELHLAAGQNTGLVNEQNYKITEFLAPDGSTNHILRTVKGRFEASNGSETLVGPALIDSVIVVTNTQSGEVIELVIIDHRRKPTWTNSAFLIDNYVLATYDDATGNYVSICADYDVEDWSVLVSSERYDWDAMSVQTTGQHAAGWFNISCAGHALFKMKVSGNDPQPPDNSPYQSTPTDRQSMLKMLSADYCGTGTSFTADGVDLHWRNSAGWAHNNMLADPMVEAYWGPDGALCVDNPRLGSDLRDAIDAECALVGKTLGHCAGFSGTYLWKTTIPAQ